MQETNDQLGIQPVAHFIDRCLRLIEGLFEGGEELTEQLGSEFGDNHDPPGLFCPDGEHGYEHRFICFLVDGDLFCTQLLKGRLDICYRNVDHHNVWVVSTQFISFSVSIDAFTLEGLIIWRNPDLAPPMKGMASTSPIILTFS